MPFIPDVRSTWINMSVNWSHDAVMVPNLGSLKVAVFYLFLNAFLNT